MNNFRLPQYLFSVKYQLDLHSKALITKPETNPKRKVNLQQKVGYEDSCL